MVNPQLVDYIKTQLAQNLSHEQIKTNLISSGWQPPDIKAAFSSLSPIKIFPLILASIAVVTMVSALSYYGFQKLLPPKSISSITPESSPSASEVATTTDSGCDAFPDKLDSCTPFKCQFIHPFTNTPMQREIVGIVGDKCNYVEQMPNNGQMECNYSEEFRKSAAQFYRLTLKELSQGNFEASISSNLVTGETKSTTTINDQVLDDPLQKAFTDGTCVISGYPNPTPL